MTDKMRSFLKGLALGLAGKPLEFAPGEPVVPDEPVAYLYNGVRLPKLPEWDKTAYPYAVVYRTLALSWYLFVSETPWHGTGENHTDIFGAGAGEATENTSAGVTFLYKDNTWVQQSNSNPPKLGQMQDTDGDGIADKGAYCAVWSNHDIIGADNSVLLAASEPIPVYE